jgi:hypothetical protein
MPALHDLEKESTPMPLSRIIVPAAALLLMMGVAFAADSPPQPQTCTVHRGHMDFLTPEARMMLFAQNRLDVAGMTDEQRQAFRKAQHDKIEAMSDADRAKFAANLKAKWDALPADQQAKMKADDEAFRASHPRPPQPPGC